MDANRPAATMAAAWRKTAIAAGVCYLITHVTSIGSAALYSPILNNAGYVTGVGADVQVLVGAFLEVILALAIVGTSVALYPVARRHNEGVALGYVGLRTLEAAIIAVGIIPLLAVVTLRQNAAGAADADTAALVTLGNALVASHNWTFLLGPGLVCGTNTVLMAYLMYTSRLVPRFIPVLGLIGGPLIFAWNTAGMFGMTERIDAWAALLVIPIFAWEVALALWLIFKGFRMEALVSEPTEADTNELTARSLSRA